MKTFPLFNTYNSDSVQRTIGIYRLAVGGVIVCDYYDYRAGKIGPYKVDERYGYVTEFYTRKATPEIVRLYEALCNSRYAMAAFFVNNTYICTVYEDRLVYTNLEDGEVETYLLDRYIPAMEMLTVGWVKTRLTCTQVAMTPFLLQMDVNTMKVFMGKDDWRTLPTVAAFQSECGYPLYKKLLEQQGKDAVYIDAATGKEIYI